MSLLLPAGITSLLDLPYNIWYALRHALNFLGFDELEKDEVPRKAIWLDGKEMRSHMKKVDSMRRAKYGGQADRMSDEPIDGPVSNNQAMKDLYV